MRKIHIHKILPGLLFSLLLCTAYLWLFNTNSGLQFAYKLGKGFLAGKLQIEGLSGSLAGPIKINTINYQEDQLTFSAHDVELDWRLRNLIFQRISVDMISANNVKISITHPEKIIKYLFMDSSSTSSLQFDLQNINLQKINLVYPQTSKPVNIDSVKLSLLASASNLKFIDLMLTSADINLQMNGQFAKQYDSNWHANINNLSNLISGLSGTIYSQGKLSGNQLSQLKADIILQGKDLQFANHKIAALNGKFITDPKQKNTTHFDLALNNIELLQSKIENITTIGDLILNNNANTILNLRFLPIKFASPATNDLKQHIINNIVLKAVRNNSKITTEFHIAPVDQSAILGTLAINNIDNINSKIKGSLDWHTESLAFLETLSPKIKNPTGKLDANFTIVGTLENPEWSGKFDAKHININIPTANLQLNNGNFLVNVTPQEIKYSGQISSNNGSNLNISALTKLNLNSSSTEANITGQNFLLSDTPSVNIEISPDIKARINDRGIDLSGSIIIPKARVELQNFSEVETLPKDVVFVGQKQSRTPEMDIYSHISIILEDNIYLSVQGLRGNIAGKVLIDGDPKRTITGNGTLILKDGSYDIRGQNLKIEQGQIIFSNSPITNPNLNIQAFREINSFGLHNQKLMVGVNIKGTVSNPLSTLYSEPSGLSQEDILSYLLLGQPSTQIDDFYSGKTGANDQISLMLNALKTLNIGGSGNKFTALSDNLRKHLGLAELGLTTNSIETKPKDSDNNDKSIISAKTALALGKYLSPSLYIGYSIGILDQMSTFKVRYRLWKNFILQTETSTLDTGVDLLYSIARD